MRSPGETRVVWGLPGAGLQRGDPRCAHSSAPAPDCGRSATPPACSSRDGVSFASLWAAILLPIAIGPCSGRETQGITACHIPIRCPGCAGSCGPWLARLGPNPEADPAAPSHSRSRRCLIPEVPEAARDQAVDTLVINTLSRSRRTCRPPCCLPFTKPPTTGPNRCPRPPLTVSPAAGEPPGAVGVRANHRRLPSLPSSSSIITNNNNNNNSIITSSRSRGGAAGFSRRPERREPEVTSAAPVRAASSPTPPARAPGAFRLVSRRRWPSVSRGAPACWSPPPLPQPPQVVPEVAWVAAEPRAAQQRYRYASCGTSATCPLR